MKVFQLILVFLASQVAASQTVTFIGEVKNSSNQLIKTYQIEANLIMADSKNEHFSLVVPINSLYQFTFSAPGYYSSVHTFSHNELQQFYREGNNKFKLPKITLVAKKAQRTLFAFGGDVMMGRRFSKPYFDEPVLIGSEKKIETQRLLNQVKPYMELADFSAVNLESQVSENEPAERAPKSVTFYSPPEIIDALKWSGIDYVTLGNNHIYDYVEEGLRSTLHHLNEKKMAYSGAGLTQQQALKPYRYKGNEQEYDLYGFVGWKGGFSPSQVAEAGKGGSAFGTRENIIKTVTQSSQANKATIIQYHGSLEYKDEPSGVTEAKLKSAIDHGADLVVAHHPHVTQGFELYKNKLIAYSMGNFVFDQYFYDTPLSYILYVWMDGEEFYRAEIVPVYIKGYQPTPATGIQRHKVSNRASYLSQKRRINMGKSGGHLVIQKDDLTTNEMNQTISISQGHRVQSLYHNKITGTIKSIETEESDVIRLGVNQLNGGDFETFNAFDSNERGFMLSHAEVGSDASGGQHLKLDVSKNKEVVVGMQYFRRIYDAASLMTLVAEINTEHALTASLYLQVRKNRAKFFQAIDSPMKLLGSVTIEPAMKTQKLLFDFDLPRVGYRSYRVVLKVTANDAATVAYLDNLELIQWGSYYHDANRLPNDDELLSLATHLSIKQKKEKDIHFKVVYE